jgi:hypothetical protein
MMQELSPLSHDVPGQVTGHHGKQNGNDDEIYLLDTGGEVVLQGEKMFYLDMKQSEEEKIVNKAGKNKDRGNGQVECL